MDSLEVQILKSDIEVLRTGMEVLKARLANLEAQRAPYQPFPQAPAPRRWPWDPYPAGPAWCISTSGPYISGTWGHP